MMRLIDADKLSTALQQCIPPYRGDETTEIENELGMQMVDVFHILQEQPTVNQWIPCCERLPEIDDKSTIGVRVSDTVTVCDKYGEVDTGWLNKSHIYREPYWKVNAEDADENYIVAWMPLPEPYRADGK